ncbi:MAG TPA: uroporphyrinogen decarboxylase family protein [Patescibacteria group bacterium]|nr:uroporphyrinogen decarboxylase family protein [Patescibacteria group bacterium]
MDAQTRVLRTLSHQEPDKVPMFESTFTNDTIMKDYGVKPGHLGPLYRVLTYLPFRHKILNFTLSKKGLVQKGLESMAELYRKAGIDIFPTVTSLFPRKILKDGFIDEFGRHMHFEYYKDGTEIIGYVDGYFDSFEVYESWELPDPSAEMRMAGYLAGKELQDKHPDDLFCLPATSGLMECTWEGFGLKTFSRLLQKRSQAKKVFDDRGKFTLEVIKRLSEKGAKAILIFDDYGFKNGLFMRPAYYEDYIFPWLSCICSAAHKNGCKILLHSDGDLTEILDGLINTCHIDGLNPIEPTTANPNYDIFKIHEKYGDKITLIGNVPPNMLSTGELSEIESYSKKLLQTIGPGGGYILASGHSINPAVTPDRWKKMVEARDTYGTYPIQGSS